MMTSDEIARFKHFSKVYSLVFTLGMTVWVCILWGLAYFSGTASVVMTINDYGEMFPELIFWILFLPMIIYGFILNIKEML